MNTSEYLPYESISPNIVEAKGCEQYPGLYGTGFFVQFPPYDSVFYVTARHCVKDVIKEDSISSLKIPVTPGGNRAVRFKYVLETSLGDSVDEEREDVAVYVVSDEISAEDRAVLLGRAMRLQHQDDVSEILKLGLSNRGNLRVIGYPTHDHPNCLTEIDYGDEGRPGQIKIQPRGFYGKLECDGLMPEQYKLTDVNWNEIDYRGFSGSPVIELAAHSAGVECLPVGVVLMATQKTARFISINVICDLIAHYLVEHVEVKV